MLGTQDVLRVLRGKRQITGGWLARCPVPSHGKGQGDRNPSLSVSDKDGIALVHCHGGCDQDQVFRAITAMLPGRMFNEQSTEPTAAPTAPQEKPTNLSMEEHVLPWVAELQKSESAKRWLREQRFISL